MGLINGGTPGNTPGSGGEGGYRFYDDNTFTGGAGADGICIVRYEITQAEFEAV